MSTQRWISKTRAALAAASVMLLGACNDFVNLVTPGRENATPPARVAFTASVAQSVGSQADVVALRVTAQYARKNGSLISLGTQTITLSDAASQQVPLTLEIGPCLRDAEHKGGGSAGDAACVVYLGVELMINGNSVDQSAVGPLNLEAGATQNITDPVSLYEIASLGVAPAGGTVVGPGQRLSLLVGGTLTLETQLRDTDQKLITGRAVTWSSDAPTVATVSNTGVVTGIASGTAHITALSSGLTATATVDVAKPLVPLTVSAAASTGTGTITSAPAGINCRVTTTGASGSCMFNFAADGQVTLTATPDASMQFGPWSDMCAASGNTTTCVLAMTQPRTVGARFNALRRVTVVATGAGNGRVTSVPTGIDCQLAGANTTGTCFIDVLDNTSVTLTAAASAQHTLLGWANDCAAAVGTSCTLNVNGAARTAGVRFAAPQLLTVTPGGSGGGSIVGAGGISCVRAQGNNTGVCTSTSVFNTVVTLTATADGNSTFSGWTGACAAAQTATCNVTMNQAQTVGATFAIVQVQLQLTLLGTGAGKVTIDGSTVCTKAAQDNAKSCAVFSNLGATVQLVAEASPPSTFAGYSGACAGVALTCNVVMNSAKSVTATFTAPQIQISVVNFAGSNANGIVKSADNTINCTYTSGVASGSCITTVLPGTEMVLTATASANSAFYQWGGACLGEQSSHCSVLATTSQSVSAKFNTGIALQMTILAYGAGKLTYSAAQFPKLDDCLIPTANPYGTYCDYQVPLAANVTITMVPAQGGSGFFDGSPCMGDSMKFCFTATTNISLGGYIFPSGSEVKSPFPAGLGIPKYGPVKRTPSSIKR